MQQFYGKEAAFLSVLFAFNNLLSLYQQAIGTRSEKQYQRLAMLRSAVFASPKFPPAHSPPDDTEPKNAA